MFKDVAVFALQENVDPFRMFLYFSPWLYNHNLVLSHNKTESKLCSVCWVERDYIWNKLQGLAHMYQQEAKKYIWDELWVYWINEGGTWSWMKENLLIWEPSLRLHIQTRILESHVNTTTKMTLWTLEKPMAHAKSSRKATISLADSRRGIKRLRKMNMLEYKY